MCVIYSAHISVIYDVSGRDELYIKRTCVVLAGRRADEFSNGSVKSLPILA